ncbi:MAG: cobaltochelatase subunit CobN [Candidatus Methanomethylophilaceae archaeon]|nr:cobaltochelatase subunit CobN [Candidatus Methanomethylophilaceae archaeon]
MKVVYLSIRNVDAHNMEIAADRLSETIGTKVELYGVNSEEVNDDVLAYSDLVRNCRDADFVYVRIMGDPYRFQRFDRFVDSLRESDSLVYFHAGTPEVASLVRDLFHGTDADYKTLWNYSNAKGLDNDVSTLWYAAHMLGFTDSLPPEPVLRRPHGIYHPDRPSDVSAEDYIRSLPKTRVRAGLVFPGYTLVYHDTEHIDAVIRALEAHGMSVVPVFFSTFSDEGYEGLKGIFDQYFRPEGVPIIDVAVSLVSFSRSTTYGLNGLEETNYFRDCLNVPIIYGLNVAGEYHDFEDDRIGLSKSDMEANVTYPELNGDIITVPVSYRPRGKGDRTSRPIPDRIEHLCRVAYGWGKLRSTPKKDRKVAILMWQSTANSGNIGGAAGLDTMESIADELKRFEKEGYTVTDVPENGAELVKQILDGVTNDLDNLPLEYMREHAADTMSKKDYVRHFESIPEWNQAMKRKDWGEPPGELCVDGDDMIIPGLVKGNIYIGYQPLRGRAEKFAQNIHDPLLFPQHQYLGFYRWLRDVFKADMIIHTGTHGTLEWLPGKNVGMSRKCEPCVVLDGIPNLYPYIIDDPGEAMQTKRRSESVVIGHMTPSMARADSYDELDEVNVQLQNYLKNKNGASPERISEMVAQIYDAAKRNDMLNDLGLEGEKDPGAEGFEPYIVALHEYIEEMKDALIRANLHVLGKVPEGIHFDEMVYSLTRLDNGDVVSFRDAFAANQGFDMRSAVDDVSSMSRDELNSEAIDRIDSELMDLIAWMREDGFDTGRSITEVERRYGRADDTLRESIRYVCESVAPRIENMAYEMDNLFGGINGEFVPPGPSGAPTRGNADILPTGRNMYSLDPSLVPSKSSWEIGKRMADQMIRRYADEHGGFPREVGFVIWATDTMKTGGDDVAYILWLMGVKPVWSRTGGQVLGLEVIPLSELGRPRVDVTVNITGLFRDTFPNLIDLIDDAVKMVMDLDEDDEDNAIAANLRKDIVEGIANGLTPDEARRRNSVRLFGAPPGAYGAGVNHAVASSTWETVEDLANVYRDWCSNGYAKGEYGTKMTEEFCRRFSKVAVTVKNIADREIDILDCDDYYEFLGGMNSFVRTYGRKDFVTYMGDDSDPKKSKIRSTQEELRFTVRSKAFNPKFINGLKEHGYRGAAELANVVEFTMAWDATSGIGEDWMYEGLADRYLFDKDTQDWMREVNPYAMMNIINRLQEAIERGLWDATDEYKDKLKDLYIETEAHIEEITDR